MCCRDCARRGDDNFVKRPEQVDVQKVFRPNFKGSVRITMGAKILIVEDEVLVAWNMKDILEANGFECVDIAPDLETAGRYFGDSIDLALVDLNLRDGLTGPQIGAQLSAKGTRVIFITANPAQIGDGIAGTIGVLTKPTDDETLLAAVQYALRTADEAVAPPTALKLFG